MLPSLTRIVTRLSLVALVVTFAGCSQKDLLERISSPEDRALGGQVIADLQEGASGDADLTQRLQPDLRAKLGRVLPRMSAIVPAGPSRLVDAKYTEFAVLGGRKTRESYLAYEVDGANRAHALVRISIERQDGAPQIVALYVNSMAAKAEDLFGFSLIGKSPWQYLILALAVLSLSTIVLAEIVLFRTKGVRRKWLWAIGCLFGIGQVSVNWSTGDLGFALLYINLSGAFAVKAGMLAPWQVGFGFPIPSAIFLIRRRRLREAADEGGTGPLPGGPPRPAPGA